MTSKAKAPKPSVIRGILTPLLGFGIGWGAYSLVERYDLVEDRYMYRTQLWNVKGQRLLHQYLPSSVSSSLPLLSLEQIEVVVPTLERLAAGDQTAGNSSNGEASRVPFKQILAECRPQEQLEWLSDHVAEEIPFFFIADVFHGFGELHEEAFLAPSTEKACAATSSDPAFDAPELCAGLWRKFASGVIPFDVAVRALCVLAVKWPKNAEYIRNAARQAHRTTPQVDAGEANPKSEGTDAVQPLEAEWMVLRKHREYLQDLAAEGQKPAAEQVRSVVSRDSVDAATATLVRALDRAASKERSSLWSKALFWRRSEAPSSLSSYDVAEWCQQFAFSREFQSRLSGAPDFESFSKGRFACPERGEIQKK